MKTVQQLTLNELNFLVAKLEGIEVEIYTHSVGEDYVAEKLPFSPEGPANVFPPGHKWMYRFYQPTKDWSIAGPIIDRERICVIYSDKNDEAEKPYTWAYYPGGDADLEDVMYERDGETGCEAAMRSFVLKHFGDTIDLQNLPSKPRVAVVSINGVRIEDLSNLADDDLVFEDITVLAETSAEAERLALATHSHLFHVEANFIRWQ